MHQYLGIVNFCALVRYCVVEVWVFRLESQFYSVCQALGRGKRTRMVKGAVEVASGERLSGVLSMGLRVQTGHWLS